MSKRKLLPLLIFALTFGFGVYYYTGHREDFRLITSVSAGAVIMLLLSKLTTFLCYGLQVKVLTDHYGLNLNFTSWFGLSRLTSFTNMLLPLSGGTPIKAVYLKKIHGLNYSSFIVSNSIALILKMMMTSAVALALIVMAGGRASIVLLAVSGAVFIGAAGVLILAGRVGERYFSSWDYIRNFMGEWLAIKSDRKTMRRLILLNCLMFSASLLEVYFSFRAFNIDTSIISSGIIAAFTTFTHALQLTPDNLGLRELIFVSFSDVFGTGVNGGLHAVALHRLVGTALTLVLAPGFAWRLSNKTR